MTSKVEPAANYSTVDVKITSKVSPLQINLVPRVSLLCLPWSLEEETLGTRLDADYSTVDQKNLGTRL